MTGPALRERLRDAIVDDQARVLLVALTAGHKWQGGTYADLRARPGWPPPKPRSRKPA
jgi:hypothetical protein